MATCGGLVILVLGICVGSHNFFNLNRHDELVSSPNEINGTGPVQLYQRDAIGKGTFPGMQETQGKIEIGERRNKSNLFDRAGLSFVEKSKRLGSAKKKLRGGHNLPLKKIWWQCQYDDGVWDMRSLQLWGKRGTRQKERSGAVFREKKMLNTDDEK